MAEKQTKGFGLADEKEMFKLQEQTEASSLNTKKAKTELGEEIDEKQIMMEISKGNEGRGKKIFLNKSANVTDFSGNSLIDSFRKINNYFIDHSRIKVRDLATFFRLLATMINAGLPLIRSLNTLAIQTEESSPKLARTLSSLARSVEIGKSLSIAMEDYPEVFSEAQIGVIRAGEASGQLNRTLRDLAIEVEKSASINGKVKGALVYPIVILCLMVGVIFLMMILVVPQISKLFVEAGQQLPLPTQILIEVSNFSVAYWPFMIFGFLGFLAGFSFWKRTRNGRYMWDLFLINMPIFGNLIKKSVLSKFSRSFGNMLGSGVPIIKSIQIVAAAVGNEVYKKRLLLTAEDMKSGIPMAENLTNSSLFPTMLVNMIEIGEQTAQLENVTAKIAEFYDEEVNNSVNALTKIMEPLIIVIVGTVVGGLVAAIMLPIIQLTNVAGGLG